jgi:ligand-binding SRPBCC domain-containing protein
MKYYHRFRVPASIDQVAEFHRHSTSMAAITPPPILVRVQRSPAVLANGDEMAFTMWLGLLPVHWLARIEAVSDTGFTDRQLGPF